LALPPISLWERDEAVRRLRAEGRQQVDERRLMEVVLQQRQLVEQARRKTARRHLGRQARGRPLAEAGEETGSTRSRQESAATAERPPEESLGEVTPFDVEVGS
jgi:putative transposase